MKIKAFDGVPMQHGKSLRNVSNNFLLNGWIYPSVLAGWGQQGAKIQPKKNCFKKKYKDDQNGLIHPEN